MRCIHCYLEVLISGIYLLSLFPLCRIGLLWYHTIVRPFFALDGEDESAGAEEAERLLAQSQELYPNSALFLYFKGKVMYLR